MRIAYINETCGTGSIGSCTYELALALDTLGHECMIAHSHGSSPYKNCIRIGSALDHKFHALFSRITGLQGYFSRLATRRLIRELHAFRPDVVHLQNLHSNYINLKILLDYLARKDIATVITLHDCWFYTGKCTYYVPASCNRWQQECGSCPLLHRDNVNPTFWFDRTRKCLRDKQRWFAAIPRLAVVGVSKWVAAEARSSILGKRNPIAIYNWIDQDIFQPRPSSLRAKHKLENKFVILAVAANLSPNKGFSDLVEISRKLPSDWAIIAIGRPVSPLPENIIHIPHTNNAVQLAEYYSMADVCLNASRYETFGKVTAEAICCGTPVVVYNNTASPELVEEGCGKVVDENLGVDGLMNALSSIQAKGKGSYTATCRESAKWRFAKSSGVAQYEQLYFSLLKDNDKPAREET